jgi:hypothetical protein
MVELSERVTMRGVQPESVEIEKRALTNGFTVKELIRVVLHPTGETAFTVTVLGYGAAVSFS